jgi:hypothetical protein
MAHESISRVCVIKKERNNIINMVERKTLLILMLVLIVFISCATKQQPVKDASVRTAVKGYSEIWLDKKILQVDFKGGIDENVDKMKNLAVLRGAELGRDRHFNRFVILKTTDQAIIDGVLRSGDQYLPIEKLKVSITIKFVNKDDPEYLQAFDMDAKIADIRESLNK